MAHNRDALVGLDRKVEVAQHCPFAGWISEPNVFELDAPVCDVLDSWLRRVYLRGFLDDSKDQFGCFSRGGNRRKLGQGDSCSDRADENDVAPGKDLLRVKMELLGEHCGNVEHHGNEHEAYALRVAEEKSGNVGLLYACISRHDQQLGVSVENHVYVLGPERNDRPIVENDIRQQRVGLLVRIVHGLLIELKFGHSEAAQDH